MTEEYRLAKIEENKKTIAKLQQEIKALTGPRTIGELVTEPLYSFTYDKYTQQYLPGKCRTITATEEWQAIRRLCITLFRKNGRVSNLTDDEKYMAGKMADEIIRVRNKYFLEVHDIEEGE